MNILREPSASGMDVDDDSRLRIHKQILAEKPLLKRVFREFHTRFDTLDRELLQGTGIRIEIGAGVAPIKDCFPDVISTDIVATDGIEMVLDAQNMELDSDSVRVVFGQNVFHHLPQPSQFFDELERVLVPGGGAILLEPYYSPFAEFLFKRMFQTEGYDKEYPHWETPIHGPMNGANQALSYIVFKRDLLSFRERHPALTLLHQELCSNYLSYLLSGGLNFRQLVPDWAVSSLSRIDQGLAYFGRFLALHHIVVIRKKPL